MRAFELQTGIEVVRPNISGLMGAYGAALTARMHYEPGAVSAMMERNLDGFHRHQCAAHLPALPEPLQADHHHPDDGARHVSGNRCERGASLDAKPKKSEIPEPLRLQVQAGCPATAG